MNLLEAQEKAAQIGKTVNLKDFYVRRRYRIISLTHGDGSFFEFHRSAFVKLDDEFVAIFTEHHGTFVYGVEDIVRIKEWNSGKVLYNNKDK